MKKRWDEKNRGQERGSSLMREWEQVEKKQGGDRVALGAWLLV